MAVLQAKKLKASLEKARGVGRAEEPVTIDGCPIVLRSLSADDYEAIAAESKDLEEIAYLHAFQIGHVARAIVEIDGVDLRDVNFVEVEEELPDGTSKSVKLERQAWIRDHFLKTWSREAIFSAWRKLAEVLVQAEEKAKEGIKFTIAEETAEDKFRRILGEMIESTEELPNDLVAKILDEQGLMLKSSKEELETARDKLAGIGEVQTSEEAPSPAEPATPVVQNAESLMKSRVPMNQGAVEVPTPPPQTVVASATRPAQVPAAIRDAAVPTQSLSRAAQIAALESGLGDAPGVTGTPPASKVEAVEIRRQAPGDEKGVRSILDRPPSAGLNPRYSPPRRP
jgi:hypothetical protein